MSNSARRKIVEMHNRIAELEAQLSAQQAQTAPVVPSGWKLVDERELLKIKHALESCDAGDYSTGSVIHPSYDEKAVEDALNSVTVMLSAAPSAPIAAPSEDAKEPDWKRFALAVLIDARDNLGSDVDGGMVQDVATECGLLVKVEAQEPCDENCVCAEVGFPTDCYRYSKGTLRAIAATAQQKEGE